MVQKFLAVRALVSQLRDCEGCVPRFSNTIKPTNILTVPLNSLPGATQAFTINRRPHVHPPWCFIILPTLFLHILLQARLHSCDGWVRQKTIFVSLSSLSNPTKAFSTPIKCFAAINSRIRSYLRSRGSSPGFQSLVVIHSKEGISWQRSPCWCGPNFVLGGHPSSSSRVFVLARKRFCSFYSFVCFAFAAEGKGVATHPIVFRVLR